MDMFIQAENAQTDAFVFHLTLVQAFECQLQGASIFYLILTLLTGSPCISERLELMKSTNLSLKLEWNLGETLFCGPV